jgi:hypothetical protein
MIQGIFFLSSHLHRKLALGLAAGGGVAPVVLSGGLFSLKNDENNCKRNNLHRKKVMQLIWVLIKTVRWNQEKIKPDDCILLLGAIVVLRELDS